MKLTNTQADRIWTGIKSLDVEENDLSPETRLKMAVNMNRLTPYLQAFSKIVTARQDQIKSLRELMEKESLNGAAHELADRYSALVAETNDLFEASVTDDQLRLKKFKVEELKLQNNRRITSESLAFLAPVISDLEKAAGGDED